MKVRIAELREIVEDGARKFFDAQVEKLREQYGHESDLATFDDAMSSHLRKKVLSRAVDMLCDKGDLSDISRIRKVVNEGELPYSSEIVKYFGKFGEWKDIEIVLSILEGRSGIWGLLDSHNEDLGLASEAIFRLGKGRLAEFIETKMPDRLFSRLMERISDRIFRTLPEKLLLRLLRNKSDAVRKVVAIKCLRCFSRKNLSTLMANYISGDQVAYYNVVHWLDLGVSLPRSRALNAVEVLLG